MTVEKLRPTLAEIKASLAADGDFLKLIIRAVLQQVLEAEMTEALGAAKGERSEGRLGYRSGYYARALITRVGKIELKVPQDRQGRFSTELFERYQRSEKALVAALAEMYVQGVSTRKVRAITEELIGHAFSASSISAIVTKLDGELARVRRPAACRAVRVCRPRPALREGAGGRRHPVASGSDRRRDRGSFWRASRSAGCTALSTWSLTTTTACARRFGSACRRPRGSAATCIF